MELGSTRSETQQLLEEQARNEARKVQLRENARGTRAEYSLWTKVEAVIAYDKSFEDINFPNNGAQTVATRLGLINYKLILVWYKQWMDGVLSKALTPDLNMRKRLS